MKVNGDDHRETNPRAHKTTKAPTGMQHKRQPCGNCTNPHQPAGNCFRRVIGSEWNSLSSFFHFCLPFHLRPSSPLSVWLNFSTKLSSAANKIIRKIRWGICRLWTKSHKDPFRFQHPDVATSSRESLATSRLTPSIAVLIQLIKYFNAATSLLQVLHLLQLLLQTLLHLLLVLKVVGEHCYKRLAVLLPLILLLPLLHVLLLLELLLPKLLHLLLMLQVVVEHCYFLCYTCYFYYSFCYFAATSTTTATIDVSLLNKRNPINRKHEEASPLVHVALAE